MRSFAARIAGAALCVLAVGAAARQDRPPQTPPIFRGGIDIVQVDVSVLDKKRKPVRGLTAADFTVLENGKPQKIIAVSEVVLADEVASPPVWARAAPPDVASNDVEGKRIFAIVIALASILAS